MTREEKIRKIVKARICGGLQHSADVARELFPKGQLLGALLEAGRIYRCEENPEPIACIPAPHVTT